MRLPTFSAADAMVQASASVRELTSTTLFRQAPRLLAIRSKSVKVDGGDASVFDLKKSRPLEPFQGSVDALARKSHKLGELLLRDS